MSNTSFGRNVLTNNFDPGHARRAGACGRRTGISASRFSSRLGARSSVDVAYTRRWFHGFSVADNLALAAIGSDRHSASWRPLDPRLPGGGGYVVSGLYDVVPEKAGQVNNLVADSSEVRSWSQYFNGVDVTVNVRVGERLHARRRHEHGADRRRQLRRPRAAAGARHDDDRHERVRRRSERIRP